MYFSLYLLYVVWNNFIYSHELLNEKNKSRLKAYCNNLIILVKKCHLNKNFIFIQWIINCRKSAHRQQIGNLTKNTSTARDQYGFYCSKTSLPRGGKCGRLMEHLPKRPPAFLQKIIVMLSQCKLFSTLRGNSLPAIISLYLVSVQHANSAFSLWI